MDSWNPRTFDAELCEALASYSDLIVDYHREERRLMDAHLNSDPYESLKPNRYYTDYMALCDETMTPLFIDRRVRVWHYTRLLDDEVSSMKRKLVPSTLSSLRQRLETLVMGGLLAQDEAEIVFRESPFQEQEDIRSNRFWTTTTPLPPDYDGVEPLLGSWGGESAYFWLRDETVSAKLRNIGIPRIVEIETALGDTHNASSTAGIAIRAWARNLGEPVNLEDRDLAITDCLETAQVLRIHTAGDGVFEKIGKSYPDSCGKLLGK